MTSPRTLDDFEGKWQLFRKITPAQGPVAVFEGIAVWSRATNGCDYSEQGLMTLAGQPPLHAERRYFWSQDLSVFFADGRFFHRIPSAGGQTEHWCDPDHYTGTYRFALWPQFEVVWQVRGPNKDYRSHTLYTRS